MLWTCNIGTRSVFVYLDIILYGVGVRCPVQQYTGKCEDLNAWEWAEYEIPRLFCVRSEIGISSDVAFLLREMAHIGNEIREVLKQQGRTVTWFAEQLNCNRTNIYNIFKKEDLDTQLLKRICLILDYNFFQEVCTEINTQVSKNS